MSSAGLHHVTAISGAAKRNLEFYTCVLGLILVKKTVNFDDPGTYHLYYGDEAGQPGTVLTFFPWDDVSTGQVGVGETQLTSFRVPSSSIAFWARRLAAANVAHAPPSERFGEPVLPFKDADGLSLSLVGVDGIENEPAWSSGGAPMEHAIRGFHGVSLLLRDAEPTAAILQDVFGFKESDREGGFRRFSAPGDDPFGHFVDLDSPQEICRAAGKGEAACITSLSELWTTKPRPRWLPS